MPRTARVAPGGCVYHVLNRSVARLALFRNAADYAAFEEVLLEAHELHPTRLLSWCLMRDHWHFVIWPRKGEELTAFMRWLTHTHVMRRHVAHGTVGSGSVYGGRFRSFPVQRDDHFLSVCRYVESKALRAHDVDRAEDWRWSSLWTRQHDDAPARDLQSKWPVDPPRNWVAAVNRSMAVKDIEEIETCIKRSRPFGTESWQKQTAARLGLMASLRPPGRPKRHICPAKR